MTTAATVSVGPRYAPEDPTLPKPWRGLVDGKTGYLYYWNPETNVTQYERPTAAVSKPSSAPLSSSIQVHRSSEGQRYGYSPDRDDHRHRWASSGGPGYDDISRANNQNVRAAATSSPNTVKGTVPVGYGTSSMGSSLSVDAYRRRHEITFHGDRVPPPMMSFDTTNFPSEILREVHAARFDAPTPIQAQSWPIALQGRDIVAIAKTGSGKTLGYLIPGFIHLKQRRNNPRMGPTVLVVAPTRELATQIQVEAVKFGKSSRISCTCLYGGAAKGPQLRDLERGVDVVVATPGRLNDILEMRRISLMQVSYLVLDEADRMLDMGFEPQIRKIVKEVPSRRQTLMFTATWPKDVRKIAADLLINPIQVNIGNVDELVANKAITQHVEVLAPIEKHRRLEQILRSQEPGSRIIIFCSTKKMCDQLARNLNRNFGAAAIHGDKSQSERDSVLGQFKTGRSPILVATDVAARGLDIKDVRAVINYDFPTGVEDYVHRIGRTGRAGATGVAYTFFSDQDARYASDLIKILEGANQKVPAEIRSMATRGGGGSKFRRWGGSSNGGGSHGGRGGHGDSGFGGRAGWSASYGGRDDGRSEKSGGGRGYGNDSRDRYGGDSNGYERGRSRSRSPIATRGTGFGGSWHSRARSHSRSRSRSHERFDRNRSPVGGSFNPAIMEKSHPHRHSSYDGKPPRDSLRPHSPVGGRKWSELQGQGQGQGQGRDRKAKSGPNVSFYGEDEDDAVISLDQ